MIESRAWIYEEATNGQEALKLLQGENLPDVILMDLAMPIMDGYEATRRIKSDPRLRAIPLIVLTAHAMPGDQERAEQAGCDYYFTKPVQTGELLELLQTVLHHQPPLETLESPSSSPQVIRTLLTKLIMCEGSLDVNLLPARTALRAWKEELGISSAAKETP
jgi:CheY-like chemotaxis protein